MRGSNGPVNDRMYNMMRLGITDGYQVATMQRFLGITHDMRAWAGFAFGGGRFEHADGMRLLRRPAVTLLSTW